MTRIDINFGNIQAMAADLTGPVGMIIEEKTLEVESVAKGLVSLPGSGRVYEPGVLVFRSGAKIYSNKSEGGNVPHEASAPGAPPARETGVLLASIDHKMGVDGTVYGVVGTPDIVGRYMELGTHRRDGSVGVLPRPWLVPALYIVVPA